MAVSRDIALNVLAKIDAYRKEISKLPGMTDEAAAKAALKMQNRFASQATKTFKAQEKAAKASAAAWSKALTAASVLIAAKMVKDTVLAVAALKMEMVHYRNEIGDLSGQTAIATSTLAGLRLAVEASGGQLNELRASLLGFPKRLDDFRRGTGEAKDAMEGLGFSAKDADALMGDVDGTLVEVLRRLKGVENDGRRAAMAVSIFGEAGGRLNQVLESGAIDDWIDAAAMGVDVSEQSIQKAAEWQTATTLLSNQWRGFKADMVDALVGGTEGLIKFGGALVFTRTLLSELAGAAATAGLGFVQLNNAIRLKDASLGLIAAKNLAEGARALASDTGGATTKAAEAQQAYEALARVLLATAGAGQTTTTVIKRTSEEADKLAKSAAEAAKQQQAMRAAMASFGKLRDSIGQDQATEADKAQQAFDDRLTQISQLQEKYISLGLVLDTNRLILESEARLHRDLGEIATQAALERAKVGKEAHVQALEQIEERRDAAREAIEEAQAMQEQGFKLTSGFINSTSKAFELAAESRAKTNKKAAKKMARGARSVAAFGVGVDTASAIMKAFAMFGPPPSPAGVAAAGAAAFEGLVQTAAIRAAPLPSFFGGGTRAGSSGAGPRESMAVVHPGEAVLNSAAVDRLGAGMVAAINSGLAPLQGMGGGGGGAPVYLNGEVVGRVVADMARSGGALRDATSAGFAGFGSAYGRN